MKTKWGQNFLSDPKILSKIADAAKIKKEDTVVEIGPGKGSLTLELLKKASKVIAIEKDGELAKELENKFSVEIKDNKLQIIVADILDYNLKTTDYKLTGNIPYYITGEIFRKFLESDNQPKSITFVIQKEVAERIIARDKKAQPSHKALPSSETTDGHSTAGKESILSISIKAYGEPKYGGIIKAGSFFPKPKVDSAILSVENINKEKFREYKITEKKFFEVVRTGFAHKRKFLIKNLTNLSRTDLDIERVGEVFDELGIDKKIRAEDLKIEDWFKIAEKILH